MSVVVHGDDFVFEGPSGVFDDVVKDLKEYWIIKVRAILGPEQKDEKEVSILNRVLRWTNDGIEYEADPRQIEKLLEGLHLDGEGVNTAATPGQKPLPKQLEKDQPLPESGHTDFRDLSARTN